MIWEWGVEIIFTAFMEQLTIESLQIVNESYKLIDPQATEATLTSWWGERMKENADRGAAAAFS